MPKLCITWTEPLIRSVITKKRVCYGFKGTVPRLNLLYFIKLCEILAMKLHVCEEIITMDLNDKALASLQPNMSPGNETAFENCSA